MNHMKRTVLLAIIIILSGCGDEPSTPNVPEHSKNQQEKTDTSDILLGVGAGVVAGAVIGGLLGGPPGLALGIVAGSSSGGVVGGAVVGGTVAALGRGTSSVASNRVVSQATSKGVRAASKGTKPKTKDKSETQKKRGKIRKKGSKCTGQIHHPIPVAVADLLNLGKKCPKIDVNDPSNGICLPTKKPTYKSKPQHNGSHPSYNKQVEDILRKKKTCKEIKKAIQCIKSRVEKNTTIGKLNDLDLSKCK